KLRVPLLDAFSPGTRSTNTAGRQRHPLAQLPHPGRDRRPRKTGAAMHFCYTSTGQSHCLRRRNKSSSPFVQLWQQGSQLCCQGSASSHTNGTYHSSEYSYSLFIDDALEAAQEQLHILDGASV
ncbi:MAG: hypothetical protein AAB385_04025, partial [Planctomycetota bacterium]